MPTLRDLQTTMMNVLLGASKTPTDEIIAAIDAQSAGGLQIYQSNAAATFARSLRSSFPVTARLVGDDYFEQLARTLQRQHPSRSGDLLWVGEYFPAYLAKLHAEGEYRYLPDVARLEWLCQESLLAAEHEPFNLRKLAGEALAHHETLIFILHPSLRMMESAFPVLRIWQSNASTAEGAQEAISLAGGGADCLLLLRPRSVLEFHRLNPGERDFLLGIAAGNAFAPIVDACLVTDPHFDATTTLRRFVGMGAIVDCCW